MVLIPGLVLHVQGHVKILSLYYKIFLVHVPVCGMLILSLNRRMSYKKVCTPVLPVSCKQSKFQQKVTLILNEKNVDVKC